MPSDESTPNNGPAGPGDAMQRLSASAQGWHTIQLAVLGFMGICGVLRQHLHVDPTLGSSARSNIWPSPP